MNIPTKFGSNLPSGFREEDENVKVYKQRHRPVELNSNTCFVIKFFYRNITLAYY